MDVIDVNPPSLSQQATADSESENDSLSSMSVPPTPSLPPPVAEASPKTRECRITRSKTKARQNVKVDDKEQPRKCVFYQCEKCQNMSMNRLAYNQHIITCHGRNNAPRAAEIIDVRAVQFEKAPIMSTCIYCECYTQQRGPVLQIHEYICGERLWRNEQGDPPYIPPYETWYCGQGSRQIPADFDKTLQEFARGGLWELEERQLLTQRRLEYLLPVTDRAELTSTLKPKVSVSKKPVTKPVGKVPTENEPKAQVAIVKPLAIEPRRRTRGRRRITTPGPDPLYSILIGSVFDIKNRGMVGYIVIVGEPRLGYLVLEPMNKHRSNVLMHYRMPGQQGATFHRAVAASVALHEVKTGKVLGVLECPVPPRQWESEYHIFADISEVHRRCPSISVTYKEIPTELLTLFRADQLSSAGPTEKK